MKKTLIALAAVAATGAAFAQSSVTLSGALDYGYQSTKAGATGVTTKGMGVDTSEIYVSMTEDLGGGLKLNARAGIEGLNRTQGFVDGLNHTIGLTGGFGTIYGGAIEIGSGIRGLAQAGAPVNNMEGEILGSAVDSDILKYSSPNISGFVFSGSLTEGNVGVNLANGFGKGLSAGNSRALTVGADYAAGPIKAKLDYTSWKNNAANDDRFRVAGQYDLGVAKIGAGFESADLVAGGKNKYTMLGVSAPLGAVTVGAVWVKNDNAGAKRVGYSVGASYDLSKRTSVSSSYSSWEATANAASKDNKFKVQLSHSF